MSEHPAEGLRERKKLKTRAMLIEAAADLCQRQGYDKTTVEQISAAAEVSPRTFSRYFPTKDAVIFAVIEETAEYVAGELLAQPTDISEFEAMLHAHLAALRPAPDGQRSPIFSRMATLIQIVNSSASLAVTNIPYRQQADRFPTVRAVATRMGLPNDHDAVHLVLETWTAVMNSACRGLGTPGEPPIEPQIVASRVTATYELFLRTQRPWTVAAESADVRTGSPPASAP